MKVAALALRCVQKALARNDSASLPQQCVHGAERSYYSRNYQPVDVAIPKIAGSIECEPNARVADPFDRRESLGENVGYLLWVVQSRKHVVAQNSPPCCCHRAAFDRRIGKHTPRMPQLPLAFANIVTGFVRRVRNFPFPGSISNFVASPCAVLSAGTVAQPSKTAGGFS